MENIKKNAWRLYQNNERIYNHKLSSLEPSTPSKSQQRSFREKNLFIVNNSRYETIKRYLSTFWSLWWSKTDAWIRWLIDRVSKLIWRHLWPKVFSRKNSSRDDWHWIFPVFILMKLIYTWLKKRSWRHYRTSQDKAKREIIFRLPYKEALKLRLK